MSSTDTPTRRLRCFRSAHSLWTIDLDMMRYVRVARHDDDEPRVPYREHDWHPMSGCEVTLLFSGRFRLRVRDDDLPDWMVCPSAEEVMP